jgi:hypothetical protein
LCEREKLELIEGDLISKTGKNSPHITAMLLVMGWLFRVFGTRYVRPENLIDVSPEDNPTNEPQPDLAVLLKPFLSSKSANPGPSDVRLLVEAPTPRWHSTWESGRASTHGREFRSIG